MSGKKQRKKRQLLERDGERHIDEEGNSSYIFRCYLCLKVLNPDELEIEHKVPVSRGGSNGLGNLGLSCGDCNIEKANMTVEEYVEWRELTPEQKKQGRKHQGRRRLTQSLKSYWPNEPDHPDASYAWPETEIRK